MELNDNNFNDFVKDNNICMVEFWASWCEPCKALEPVLNELEKTYKIGRVNVDMSGQITSYLHIMSVPTIVVFKEGQPISQLSGGITKDKIEKVLNKLKEPALADSR